MNSAAVILFDKNNPDLTSALSANPLVEKIVFSDGHGGKAVSMALEAAAALDYVFFIPSSAGVVFLN